MYHRMVDAQYEHHKYMEPIWIKRFQKETQGFVFDTDHWGYACIDASDRAVGSEGEGEGAVADEPSEEVRVLYKALAMHVHPDKCCAMGAHDTFTRVSSMYKSNDVQGLKSAMAHFEKTGSVVGFSATLTTAQKKEFVSAIESRLFYAWFHDQGAVLRLVLVDPKVLEERTRTRSLAEKLLPCED